MRILIMILAPFILMGSLGLLYAVLAGVFYKTNKHIGFAMVRMGMGKKKVVTSGSCFRLPLIHRFVYVDLSSAQLVMHISNLDKLENKSMIFKIQARRSNSISGIIASTVKQKSLKPITSDDLVDLEISIIEVVKSVYEREKTANESLLALNIKKEISVMLKVNNLDLEAIDIELISDSQIDINIEAEKDLKTIISKDLLQREMRIIN